jgi:hypothetical protein
MHGRLLLFNFGRGRLEDRREDWSTNPMLLFTPGDDNGQNIESLLQRFELVTDYSGVQKLASTQTHHPVSIL